MQRNLVIGDLTAKIPIIQGGMGVGISLSRLAGAVSKEGGIGVISSAQIGFMEKDFDTNTLEANLRALKFHIQKARETAPEGILGVNIMVVTRNYEQYVREAVNAGVDVIISGAGLPLELPKIVGDSKVKLIPIVSSLRAAQIIFKMWLKKDKKIADAIIIEGPKAGGHLGFNKEDLDNIGSMNYEEEIKSIIQYIREFSKENDRYISVITAGGIDTKEEYERQFELGADGVQIATRFVTTYECDAHENYKNAYLNCKQEDIIIVKSPVGMPGRAIRNKFTEKVMEESIPVKKCRRCITTCKPDSTRYCITDALVSAATGNTDKGLLFCGANAYREEKIRSVREVIDEFIDG
jgi:nitronate monooxygenase